MVDISIHAEHIGKRYILGQQQRQETLREAISTTIRTPFQRLAKISGQRSNKQFFWALKDISFDINEGEVVGIIGRNGAGKSTLLKILSRITTPTEGCIKLYGRVGSLLEVGTGFHLELTGRENIYLNGSILGMRKRDIESNFEEIVKFADIDSFLDTPVKHYSSGMHVRLAFAVAAHLDPEILLVDEILAVGDAEFQKKCLGKIKDVSGEGRTVLFVSHNMNAIEQLCGSCMMLENGTIKRYGLEVREMVKEYLFGAEGCLKTSEWINRKDEFDNPWFKPLHFFLGDADGNNSIMPVNNDSEIYLYLEGDVKLLHPALCIGYAIYCDDGTLLYWSFQTDGLEENWIKLSKGINVLRSKIPGRFLNEGIYRIECIGRLHSGQWLFEPGRNAPPIFLTIQGGLSDSPYWMSRRPGILAPVMDYRGKSHVPGR
ncbi:MAG: ABC transporter ATP-binding protein [Methanothrix sp.]|nr:ABC transporter ATP-binding protein [Methanothrix sp.]